MRTIDSSVIKILERLESFNHEAYIVGGAVRDYLLNRDIHDIDITTSAIPEEIKEIFKDYPLYETGKELGTVTLLEGNEYIDITPFRKEGKYLKHRRPEHVTYGKSLKEDLIRRDFTVNALCLNSKLEVTDLFEGLKDLKEGIIRTVGNPDERFDEDALRILRAIRFKAVLGFKMEENTQKAIFKNKDLLKDISSERKREELLKILSEKYTYEILKEYEEIFKVFITFDNLKPKVNGFNDPYQKLAYLLNDASILKKLTFSTKERELVSELIKIRDTDINDDYSFIKSMSHDTYIKERLEFLSCLNNANLSKRHDSLKEYAVTFKTLCIDGYSLKTRGYEGIHIKKIQEELMEEIRHQRLKNDPVSIDNYLSHR